MTVEQENGMLSENNQTTEYGKVDRIETKSLTDLLGSIVESAQEENSDKN